MWRFLLTGGVALENPHPNPCSEWLSEKSWGEIVRASNLTILQGFMNDIGTNTAGWKKLYDSSTPHEDPLPEPWDSKLKGLDRYMLNEPDKIYSKLVFCTYFP